jgi:hypothetical protein
MRNPFVVTSAAPKDKVLIFVGPNSLTFPLAASLVVAFWGGIKALWAPGDSVLVPLGLAFLIGFIIFATTMTDEDARPKDFWGWASAIGITVINTGLLWFSALGFVEIT